MTDSRRMVEVIDGFKSKLFRFAYRMLQDREDAEDAIQELLIKVWKQGDRFFEIENKEAWCMTLTRNICIDKIRKRKMKKDSLDTAFFLKDNSPNPEDLLQSSDKMKEILKHINALPEPQKAVVQLRDIEGYKYDEISEITGQTLDQVKSNLHRARIKLRKILINHAIR